MKERLRQKRINLFLSFLLIFCVLAIGISYRYIPEELYLLSGKDNEIAFGLPVKVNITSENNEILEVNGNIASEYAVNLSNPVNIKSNESGIVDLRLKIFGILPANMQIKVLPDIKLHPGGQLVGVKLETQGVIVVGLQELEGVDNKTHNPGKDANLMLGDIIYEINNMEVNTAQEVIDIINENKEETLKLQIARNGKKETIKITPVQCSMDDQYRLGLWVRDNTAGIGTVTFYEEKSSVFGALGHPITDITTNVTVPVKDGSVVNSRVLSILPGKSGVPGEIRGIFYNENNTLGDLTQNTNYGIFGTFDERLDNSIYNEPLEIGLQNDVEVGPAQILTTLDDKVQVFDIEIEEINKQYKKSDKGLVIKVIDEELLEQTGGIIQGMSGSPIIQDNKIVGAVTHVFVNDPSQGYGIFIEWMLDEAGISYVE